MAIIRARMVEVVHGGREEAGKSLERRERPSRRPVYGRGRPTRRVGAVLGAVRGAISWISWRRDRAGAIVRDGAAVLSGWLRAARQGSAAVAGCGRVRLRAFSEEPIDAQQHISTVLPTMVRVRAVVRLDVHQVRAQSRQVEVEAIGMQALDEVASLEDLDEEARLEWQSGCTQRAVSMQSVAIRMHSKGRRHAIRGVRHALTRQWPLDAVSSAHTSYVQSSTASPSSIAAEAHAALDGFPIQAGAAAAVVTALKPFTLKPFTLKPFTLKPAELPALEPELISSDLLGSPLISPDEPELVPSCTGAGRSGLPKGLSGLMRKGNGAPGGVCGLGPADSADFADSADLCLARAGRDQPNALGVRGGMLAEPPSLAFAECGRRA
jgi:hypothetical protein